MAPSGFFHGQTPRPVEAPLYFMTFRGKCRPGWWWSSSARPDLLAMWTNANRQGVRVDCTPMDQAFYTKEDEDIYNEMLNTAYAIVPHGDNRWNMRFSEAVGACAIPVVIADGITLPYAELIDWSDVAIQLPESIVGVGANPDALLNHLPRDPEEIRRRRQKVCDINSKYFATEDKRLAALLKAAAVYVQRGR